MIKPVVNRGPRRICTLKLIFALDGKSRIATICSMEQWEIKKVWGHTYVQRAREYPGHTDEQTELHAHEKE